MNAEGRKQILSLQNRIGEVKSDLEDRSTMPTGKEAEYFKNLAGKLDDIKSDIDDLQGEEQEKFDNLSEGFQQGERGQAIEAAASALSDVSSPLENAISKLEDIEDGITEDDLEDAVNEVISELDTADASLDEAAS